MTSVPDLYGAFHGKKVLVTGHTGFKGSWLSEWLLGMGARPVGVALAPETNPALFDELDLGNRMEHHIHDIRDREGLARLVLAAEPDYVFHLAAQPLVRRSYKEPVETFETNVMGTVNLLHALAQLAEVRRGGPCCAAIIATTDKCYENREWLFGYREIDPLGGHDPYSASKACAELAVASFRSSFFGPEAGRSRTVGLATARAGNVIGGGDWAEDRILTDSIRQLASGAPIEVRNPDATRPWQHVLEPLAGYLTLAAAQRAALEAGDAAACAKVCDAFNFGPELASNQPVRTVVEEILRHWPGSWTDVSSREADAPHEAGRLNLAWDKAHHLLGWRPVWDFARAVEATVAWYREHEIAGGNARKLVARDIAAFEADRARVGAG